MNTEKQYWLDDPGNVNKVIYAVYVLCALLIGLDLLRNEPLLFSISGHYSSKLDRGILPETLQQEFEDHEHSLSNHVVVSMQDENRIWLITDEAHQEKYKIQLDADHLDIYHQHNHFFFEEWFGIYGWFGFTACVGLVLAAKMMRKILQREEDYYDR